MVAFRSFEKCPIKFFNTAELQNVYRNNGDCVEHAIVAGA